MERNAHGTIDSPVGPLALSACDGRLTGVGFGAGPGTGAHDPVLDLAATQLGEYFRRARRSFDLPLAPPTEGLLGRVLGALAHVPYGETVSYKELTRAAGIDASRVREVGSALGRNPLAIVIPCHRVIGADGGLVGFGGGLERKRRLLDLEALQLQLA
jgi:methylated-DNA-[protein]-cysteine S-methyltransferase